MSEPMLPDNWKLPKSLIDRIGEHGGRQRNIQEEGHTLIILHFPPSLGDLRRKPYFIWIQPDKTILTYPLVHKNPHDFIDSYFEKLKSFEEMYDAAQSAEEYFNLLEQLVPLHLSASRLHSTLQLTRDLLPKVKIVVLWRDDAYENERIADILLTNTKNAIDYTNAKSVEKMTLISNKMNRMAYLCIPIMALGGIFGMNIKSGLDENQPLIFWSILLVGGLIGLTNLWLLNKKI